jgi:hypothetical protein
VPTKTPFPTALLAGGRRQFNQRCAVRVMYSPNRITGQWRAHGRYITRDSVMRGHEAAAIGNQGEVSATPEVVDRLAKGRRPEALENDHFAGIRRTDRPEPTDARSHGQNGERSGRAIGVGCCTAFQYRTPARPCCHAGIKADGWPLDLKRQYIHVGHRLRRLQRDTVHCGRPLHRPNRASEPGGRHNSRAVPRPTPSLEAIWFQDAPPSRSLTSSAVSISCRGLPVLIARFFPVL